MMGPQPAMRPVPHLVVGRNGARVRDGVEMEGTDIIMDLARGTRVLVVERGISSVPVHAARCRILTADGSTGWVSERCISPIEEPSQPDVTESSTRILTATAVVRAADADAEDGPAATPAGTHSRASTAARSALHAVTTSAAFRAAVPHDAEEGPAAAPAGTHSRASTAARSALHAVTTSAAFRAAVPAEEEGPATTPAGSRSRATDAARSALRAATTSAAFRGPAAIWPEDGPAATPPGAPAQTRPSLPPLHCRICLQRLPCECPDGGVPATPSESVDPDGPP